MACKIGESIKFLEVKKCKLGYKEMLLKCILYTNEGKILYHIDWGEEKLFLNGLIPIEVIKVNPDNPMDEPVYAINKGDLNKELSWKADGVNSNWGRENER